MRNYIITCMLFDGLRRITSGFGEFRSSSTGYDHPMFRHISSRCEMNPKNQSCIIYLEDTIPEREEPPKPPPTITLNLAVAGLRCRHQPRHPRLLQHMLLLPLRLDIRRYGPLPVGLEPIRLHTHDELVCRDFH